MVIKLEDEDYIRFLNDHTTVTDDEVVDPVYKLFLDHLRPDGKSYVLEMQNAEGGSPAVVRYEDDDDDLYPIGGRDIPVVNKRRKGDKSEMADESYLNFLAHLRWRGSSFVFEMDSVRVEYEGESENSASFEQSTVTENGDVMVDVEKGLVPYESADDQLDITVFEGGFDRSLALESADCYELTDFKSKLEAVLSRPFNLAEYDKLYDEADDRKPVIKQKHLRSMTVSYETNERGQSYFDHFPDVKKKIDAADKETGLNLLRGFFFWLKNLSHEGAYKPWLSQGCEVITEDDCEIVPPCNVVAEANVEIVHPIKVKLEDDTEYVPPLDIARD